MKIKEVEALTGIAKANIRYYESQGLLLPRREPNGYRVYDESHVRELRKIKLLRKLDIPIEAIKALRDGTASLADVLSQRRARFPGEHRQLDQLEQVAAALLEAAPEYDALDPERFLAQLSALPGSSLPQDVQAGPAFPWRRFWARTFDISLCNLSLYVCFPALFQTGGFSLLPVLWDIAAVAALEPVMLWLFRATPGKLLFGITVTNPEGGRLTYRDALERTLLVLEHGLGFCLPFLREYTHRRSFTAAQAGEGLIWEKNSELNVRDESPWRYVLFVLLLAAVLAYPAGVEFDRLFPGETAYFSGETPFWNDYRVEDVLYSLEPSAAPLPLVRLTDSALAFSAGSSTADAFDFVGTFRYAPPETDPAAGVWELSTGSASDPFYRLSLGAEGRVILECYESLTLQWRWRLQRLDVLDVEMKTGPSSLYISPQWYAPGAFSGGPEPLRPRRVGSGGAITLIFSTDTPDTLLITEEVHVGGETQVRELTLSKNEYGRFQFDYTPRPEAGAYILYRVPHAEGELLFCFLC